ncbi:hypothetical protein BU16DRAFT_557400 [Lophium mytilinum]|uniref:Uncharacterized protein n=1 Tax=Lophium mytilinum TaxID=390894 RepID=A0A6A6R2W1_9PEZI|nr:hypothetical protein BU16DRAFT_557400 [Lophium mytilinum]
MSLTFAFGASLAAAARLHEKHKVLRKPQDSVSRGSQECCRRGGWRTWPFTVELTATADFKPSTSILALCTDDSTLYILLE